MRKERKKKNEWQRDFWVWSSSRSVIDRSECVLDFYMLIDPCGGFTIRIIAYFRIPNQYAYTPYMYVQVPVLYRIVLFVRNRKYLVLTSKSLGARGRALPMKGCSDPDVDGVYLLRMP